MPTLNIFDQSYTPYTSDASMGTLINFYMEENVNNPSKYKFLNTPGTTEYLNLNGSVIRGCLEHKGVGYVVKDDKVYSIVDGDPVTSTLLGTISTTTGRVSIAAINTEILFADGDKVWSYLIASNNFSEVTDAQLPADVAWVAAHLGYFLVVKPNDDQFYVSDLNDGRSWTALSFASTELYHDNLVAIAPVNQSVWMLGQVSTELWYNSGASTGAPYDRRSGGAQPLGCAAAFSTLKIGSDLYFLAQNDSGLLGVMKANESGFQLISTKPMLEHFNSYTSVDDAFAYTYTINSHTFYVITFPNSTSNRGSTWQYDISTNKWNELESYNEDNPLVQPRTRHFANCMLYLNRKLIAGDYNSGILYQVSVDSLDEAGNSIYRELTSHHITYEEKRMYVNKLVLDVQDDIETADEQPTVGLQVSKDYGYTWTPEVVRNAGHSGEHKVTSMWSRLGSSKVFTLKFSFSDGVKWSIVGVRAEIGVGLE